MGVYQVVCMKRGKLRAASHSAFLHKAAQSELSLILITVHDLLTQELDKWGSSIKNDVQRLSNPALLSWVRGGRSCLDDRGGLRARSHINVQDRLTLGLSRRGDTVPEGASLLSSSVRVTGVGGRLGWVSQGCGEAWLFVYSYT
jgi:hypothetical protein